MASTVQYLLTSVPQCFSVASECVIDRSTVVPSVVQPPANLGQTASGKTHTMEDIWRWDASSAEL